MAGTPDLVHAALKEALPPELEPHDSQIKDPEGRMRSVEAKISWGLGALAGLGVLLTGIVVFVKKFWHIIMRILLQEALPIKKARSGS